MSVATLNSVVVQGHVSRGFEDVHKAFAENFERRHELGGACAVYHRGEKVVDLWGGIRDKQSGEPWERDTMVVIHSATKGLAAMTLAIAHSRGPSSRSTASKTSRFANCSHIKPACLPLTNQSTEAWWRTWTAWRR